MAQQAENDKATKLKKRCAIIETTKRTPTYIITSTTCDSGGRPTTPDPHAQQMSKRKWERALMNWRRELKAKAKLSELSHNGRYSL